jgi:flagellar basal body-associated protein FliL
MAETLVAPPPQRSAGSPLLESVAPPAPAAEGKKAKKPKATGKKRLVKPIGGLVFALLVFHVVSPKFIKPHYDAAHPVPNGSIIELGTVGGTTQITTNLSDGHLAQISISLQMTKVGSSKTEGKLEDELMGDTISIIGAETYDELLPQSGRAALANQLLATYQRVLPPVDGAPEVSGVYFTSFVLQ